MLFNSYEFIFLFLPVVVLGYYAIGRYGTPRLARLWLLAASLVFYGWWNYRYLTLLASSVVINFQVGRTLERQHREGRPSWLLTALAVLFNLGLLGYYKYANFFVDSFNVVFDGAFTLHQIILPLAISFFTFQQIGFVVDAYRGETFERDFLDYALFITSFWQLIAGPIVHHRQVMPQFRRAETYRFHPKQFSIGLTVFTIGLFKKLVIADSLAPYVNSVYGMPGGGFEPTFLEGWIGAFCYTAQIYFDFSGYSDMAIGLGRLFNIRVPTNFNSPYKSVSIIQFWRRWHITLSLFLREYCYYPLGGNRHGRLRKYRNLMVTMVLAGWWHGAGWTFIIFGVIHGFMLITNHSWREIQGKTKYTGHTGLAPLCASVLFTFVLVAITLVLFRAPTVADAMALYEAMFGLNGWSLTSSVGVEWPLAYFALAMSIAWFLPNTNQLMGILGPGETREDEIQFGLTRVLRWKPSPLWALLVGIMFVIALVNLPKASEFLYFQF
ncbi:MAG: MBOAT family O-acyltransferase [Phycisphaerales bacterium]